MATVTDARTERVRACLQTNQVWDQPRSDMAYLVKMVDMLLAHAQKNLSDDCQLVLVHNNADPEGVPLATVLWVAR